MSRNILWLDIEAADMKTDRQGSVHQIAYIVDIDGEVKVEGNIHCAPLPGDLINAPSLDVCGVTYEQIKSYPPAIEGFKKLVNDIHKYKRLAIAGYNVQKYDQEVFTNWWYRCVKEMKRWDLKWNDYVYADCIDIRAIAIEHLLPVRGRMENFKLETVCKMYEIDITSAHDALHDIRGTRDLYYKIKKERHDD